MNSNENQNEEQVWNRHDHDRCGRGKWVKIPFVIAAIVLIKSALVLFLWNELMPELFHAPSLSFLQAIELTVLAKLLVSGGGKPFGRHGGGFGRHRFDRKRFQQNPETLKE